MKKKTYIVPGATTTTVELQQLIAYTGGGNQAGDPIVDPNPDGEDGDNRSRRQMYNIWEEEELEEV